jgi:hypothetical protein
MSNYQYVNHLWDDAKAASLDPVGRLAYRSNILGSDQRITNTGGGNTSSKVMEKDPLTGKSTEVLWVKGSGGDLRGEGFGVGADVEAVAGRDWRGLIDAAEAGDGGADALAVEADDGGGEPRDAHVGLDLLDAGGGLGLIEPVGLREGDGCGPDQGADGCRKNDVRTHDELL